MTLVVGSLVVMMIAIFSLATVIWGQANAISLLMKVTEQYQIRLHALEQNRINAGFSNSAEASVGQEIDELERQLTEQEDDSVKKLN